MFKSLEEVENYYNSRLRLFSSKLDGTVKDIRKTSVLRINIFLLTILGIYIASAYSWLLLVFITIVGFSIFIFLVKRHSSLFKQRKWLETMVSINQSEIRALLGNYDSKADGSEWIDHEHPYASDLDLFGNKSLFQQIDRSATLTGMKRLVSSLLHPLKEIDLLNERQKAIFELSRKPEFRQQFQAAGAIQLENEETTDELSEWMQLEDTSFNSAFNRLMLIINPLIGFSVILLIALNMINLNLFFLFLFLPFIIMIPKLGSINRVHSQLSRKAELLNKYSSLLLLVEKEPFESDVLMKIKNSLITGPHAASRAIRQLSVISSKFDYRLNLLVGIILNVFFLWDILQTIRLEKWKIKYKVYFNDWFEQLSQIDELNSFAGFAFNHPLSVYPGFTTGLFSLQAKNARHPFIPNQISVGNDAEFTGWKQFQIITGANMAGKSTYLRTIGINLVLGMTGAPVLADEFKFTPVDLYTGIKTSDSLQEGESYFFAELKRLETIINKLQQGKDLFIILDEILRGTNSADKQKGSKALIIQLLNYNASGLIATHDLTLGELAASFPKQVINKRFEVEIENNELKFDYKLKDGVSRNLNATFLMKKMGITL